MGQMVSRRSFLAGAVSASALALVGATGCAKETSASSGSSQNAQWDREVDVVVCGGGGTGLAAAVEAARAGASTLVLEKSDHVGGTTALSGGMLMAPHAEYEKKFKGYDGGDSAEKLYEYYMAADAMGGGLVDPELVKSYCEGALDNLAWCEEQGITYVNCFEVKPVPGIPLDLTAPPRIMIPGDETTGTESAAGTGRVHTDPLFKTASETGAEFEYNVEVKELISDADNGIIGVVAKTGKGTQRIKAKRGVVLATGGYEHNEDMAKAFSPWQYDSTFVKQNLCLSQVTNTGDGHRMGAQVGAQLTCMGSTMDNPMSPAIGRDPGGSTGDPIAGIAVNKYGARFCDEWTTYPYFVYKAYQQDEHNVWLVFDQDAFDAALDEDTATSLMRAGTLFKGSTLAEAAESVGIHAAGLEATVSVWNADMERDGVDSVFGKTAALGPIVTAPFYIAFNSCANLGTLGGLKINTDAQVLDWNNEPINRLYAGGMCSGGWVGAWYPGSGTSVGGTVHWGRLSGKNAAALEAWC